MVATAWLFYRPSIEQCNGYPLAYLLLTASPLLGVLAILGILAMLVNMVSDGIFDDNGGCTDPVIRCVKCA